jgi:hypothetical protein
VTAVAEIPSPDFAIVVAVIPLARGDTRPEELLGEALKEATGLVRTELRDRAAAIKVVPSDAASATVQPDPPLGPQPVRSALFRREDEYWTIGQPGGEFMLKNSKGLQYIARLLRDPGVELHAADLVTANGADSGDAGELLDAEAKAQYKRRLEDLREELEEANLFGDVERAAKARGEMDLLADELSRAVGLGGRDRKAASTAERARVNATRAIRAAIRRIAGQDTVLGSHLAVAIRTGTFCSYVPEPGLPISWSCSP